PAPMAKDVVVEATGTINVRNYIELVPEVSGRIVDLSSALRAGGSFAAGEVLIGIDDRDFRLALDQANAEVAGATSNLLLQQTEGEVASSNYALLHPGEPVPALVAKEPQIGQAQAQLLAAEARASAAQLDLSRTQMSLPFAGKVTSSTAEVGQMLSRGQSFGRVFALDSLEVRVPIGLEELQSLLPVEGRKALVYVGRGAMLDPISYEARVERVAAELDERTRFSKLYLRLKGNPNVSPGRFIDVKVVGPTVVNSLEIPESAEQGGGSVWIVRNNKLASVSPRIRSRSAHGILVDAFDYGQGIVVGVVPSAYMGMRVRAVTRELTNE
ncbi:MAG: HlyD family efflux transporter periplasmic adaptor subunit, partial [Pseudomonadales bacterium]|nr:HlyD family efflux transporter periplasmic adaptor subunit [Pseudomonadales bacterium]